MSVSLFTKCQILIWSILASFQAISQHSHGIDDNESQLRPAELQAPNGGVLKATGKYLVEMVASPFQKTSKLTFYISKSDFKPLLIEGITAVGVFEFEDGSNISEELIVIGQNAFATKSNRLDPFHCTITFAIKKKKVSASFHYE